MADAKKADMYVWEGIDKQGKRVKGESSGQSEALVKAALRRQGINPLKCKKKPKPLLGGGGNTKITPKDITVFSRQLATMMSSGVPLVQAFEIVGREHENAGMANETYGRRQPQTSRKSRFRQTRAGAQRSDVRRQNQHAP